MSELVRIYRLKTALLAIIGSAAGLGLICLPRIVDWDPQSIWSLIPVTELGSTIFITGTLVIAWEYLDGRDRERRDDERIRRILKESAPEFRDAVVEGFAVKPDDLSRVATPELLDSIAKNVLALRLGDRQLAEEIYTDLRDQAIRAPERWYDVDVSVRLSPAGERNSSRVPLFEVLIEWEYTVAPTHPTQRFACVSERDEYLDLTGDSPATLTWLMTPRSGLDARDRKNYELLSFSVDGEQRKIRRSERNSGQVYRAEIGADIVAAGQPVRIRQLYRVVTPQSGHRLFFEVAQPTRSFSLEIDYTDTDIAHMSVTELVSSSHRSLNRPGESGDFLV